MLLWELVGGALDFIWEFIMALGRSGFDLSLLRFIFYLVKIELSDICADGIWGRGLGDRVSLFDRWCLTSRGVCNRVFKEGGFGFFSSHIWVGDGCDI